jgi:hypothetical protein
VGNGTKEQVRQRDLRRTERLRSFLKNAKDKPCQDCGGTFPTVCMDFDHVRGKKLFDVSQAIRRRISLVRVQAEIEKCDLVCANCHRIRTSTRTLRPIPHCISGNRLRT